MMRNFALRKTAIPAVLALLSLASCCPCNKVPEPPPVRYFDAHSHTTGILPFQVYADPATFLKDPGNLAAISSAKRRELWKRLAAQTDLSGNSRVAAATLATLKIWHDADKLDDRQIDAALERVLTATPWTEFDSAYAVRGTVESSYLVPMYGGGSNDNAAWTREGDAMCDATILQLALTNTSYSEQFMSFVGGWGNGSKVAERSRAIGCFVYPRKALLDNEHFKALGKPLPQVKILLMTHTSELGAKDNGWLQYGGAESCGLKKNKNNIEPPAVTPPEDIRNALLGRDNQGKSFLQKDRRSDYFNGVIGIDTAAPEITCFTSATASDNQGEGMNRYKTFVRAVLSAARERRTLGWKGRLLVHTHVGEGGATYQFKGTGKDPFEYFPTVYMDKENQPVHVVQARKNIKKLIQAVSELKSEIPEIGDFIVFRFGHVTHADFSDALAMKQLGIEADVNLASNISTRSYYSKEFADRLAKHLTAEEELRDGDPVREFLTGPDSDKILAEHPFKYMLEAGVRTMLGSDGGGVEHSTIEQEYKRAESLIKYWDSQDPEFKRLGISIDTIHKNVQAHLKEMGADTSTRH